ncbi:DUF1758 domain-containing protein [Trichonephila inaurata madagascariensis]|uniref:DUF1758 domain-containing protein n=1 Tax=Trichonephila inaurata madagascariensis TaxID=2747483 RepID=A0A8X6YWY2_9ARAC|nr:DUF1758 domain-containing protein [Trichonephila inaurata madagascariensis]
MDALKVKRKALRVSFTNTEKSLAILETDTKNIDKFYVLDSQLDDKFSRLNEIQNEIPPLLFEENMTEYETDFETAENGSTGRILVQIYVRDLFLVKKNATARRNSDLASLYDMLETKLRALESLGHTKEKLADFLEPLVKSCLPESVLCAWERSRISEDNDDQRKK